MGAETGKINKMAESITRGSNITYQSSNITRMNWPDGRYFGEAGGSGKSMIYQFGDIATVPYTIGVNIGAGAEIAGVVHKASEETVC